MIQYTFLEGTFLNQNTQDLSLQSWNSTYRSTCVPTNNALYYFTKFGNTTATSTLNDGTVLSFPTSQSMHIVNPVLQSKIPWTNVGNTSNLCLHNKPGGIYFIMAIYNKPSPAVPWPAGPSHPAIPFFQSCGCLPPTVLFVADASLSASAAAAATTAAVALLASDESICVETNAAAATASTASRAAAWTANMILVTNPATPLNSRIAIAQAFLASCNNTAALLATKAALSASAAAAAWEVLAPVSGANHGALVAIIYANVNASNLVIANAAVAQAQFVLATVTANTPSVTQILLAQEVYIASHAAALSITIAGHAAACAVQVAAAAATLAVATASAPGTAAAAVAAGLLAESIALAVLQATDKTAADALALADLDASHVLLAVIANNNATAGNTR
ncbi:MAG: hypothetical protein WDW38_002816 [Sanguina aurantia]